MIKHKPHCCQPGPLHSTVSSGEDRTSNAASRQAPPSFLLLPCHLWHQCQDKCQEERIIGDARWVWESWSVWKDLLHGRLIPVPLFSGIFMAATLQRGPPVISRVYHPCLLQPAPRISGYQGSQQHQGEERRMREKISNSHSECSRIIETSFHWII